MMQCYCGTDASSTIDIPGLLEIERRDQMPGMSVYWLFIKTDHDRNTANVTQK